MVFSVAAGCSHAPKRPSYPESPEWSDGRFHNPGEWPNKMNASNALKWRLTPRDPVSKVPPPAQPNDGTQLRANGDRPSLTWIGHATVLVQSGGVNLLTDPNFADSTGGLFRRLAPPGIAIKDLPPIDVVVISHNHRDHLDEESVKTLGPKVHFVVPLGVAAWFRARKLPHVTELDWWQSTTVTTRSGAEVKVTMVPAQHWSQRNGSDKDRTLWGGYVVDLGGKRVYFAGDTGYPAAFAEIGKRFPGIDWALLPIGAYAPRWFMHPQHMAPEEAAQAFRELGARELLPIHWATFRLTDEPLDEPPRLLYEAMGELANRILFLPIGGTFWATRSPATASAPASQARSASSP
jgi:N-acyl-phosphatidylethanolamine-hydrolysing phospholipase D